MLRLERRELIYGEPIVSPYGNLGAPAISRNSWAVMPRTLAGAFAASASMAADARQGDGSAGAVGVSKRLDTPLQGNGQGPVRVISIAPDSPIAACDVLLGGNVTQRHRVDARRPLYLDHVDTDFSLVAPIRRLPTSGGLESVGVSTALDVTHFWDCPIITTADGPIVGWPLRLQLHRGDIPHGIAGGRAPGVAICAFEADETTPPTTDRRFYVIVDGRRRFDVIVTCDNLDGGTGTVTIDGIEPTIGPGGVIANQWAIDNLATALPLSTTAPVAYSYMGNPYFMVRVRISASGGGPVGCIQVLSWDD